MSLVLNGTDGVTFNDTSLQGAAASPYVLKNRIINGAMVIDQRNAGAAYTPAHNIYTLDRWFYEISQSSKLTGQQNQGAVTPPVGFSYYIGNTSSSSYAVLATDYFILTQAIEGYNMADLGWGTANAKTVTVSFWVRSSLTGTFGGALSNLGSARNYPFTYTISVANTWELKSVTVAGDTSGTWLSTNSVGMYVRFSLGMGTTYSGPAGAWSGSLYLSATGATSVVGTNGATFYITGVQLEQNTSATPFERRLYNQELANCQRYFETSYDYGTVAGTVTELGRASGIVNTNDYSTIYASFKVSKRAQPTMAYYDPVSGTAGNIRNAGVGSVAVNTVYIGFNSVAFGNNTTTNGQMVRGQFTASAEL